MLGKGRGVAGGAEGSGRGDPWLLMVEVEVGAELAVAFVVPRSFWQEPNIPRTGCHQGLYQGRLEARLPGWLRGLS